MLALRLRDSIYAFAGKARLWTISTVARPPLVTNPVSHSDHFLLGCLPGGQCENAVYWAIMI